MHRETLKQYDLLDASESVAPTSSEWHPNQVSTISETDHHDHSINLPYSTQLTENHTINSCQIHHPAIPYAPKVPASSCTHESYPSHYSIPTSYAMPLEDMIALSPHRDNGLCPSACYQPQSHHSSSNTMSQRAEKEKSGPIDLRNHPSCEQSLYHPLSTTPAIFPFGYGSQNYESSSMNQGQDDERETRDQSPETSRLLTSLVSKSKLDHPINYYHNSFGSESTDFSQLPYPSPRMSASYDQGDNMNIRSECNTGSLFSPPVPSSSLQSSFTGVSKSFPSSTSSPNSSSIFTKTVDPRTYINNTHSSSVSTHHLPSTPSQAPTYYEGQPHRGKMNDVSSNQYQLAKYPAQFKHPISSPSITAQLPSNTINHGSPSWPCVDQKPTTHIENALKPAMNALYHGPDAPSLMIEHARDLSDTKPSDHTLTKLTCSIGKDHLHMDITDTWTEWDDSTALQFDDHPYEHSSVDLVQNFNGAQTLNPQLQPDTKDHDSFDLEKQRPSRSCITTLQELIAKKESQIKQKMMKPKESTKLPNLKKKHQLTSLEKHQCLSLCSREGGHIVPSLNRDTWSSIPFISISQPVNEHPDKERYNSITSQTLSKIHDLSNHHDMVLGEAKASIPENQPSIVNHPTMNKALRVSAHGKNDQRFSDLENANDFEYQYNLLTKEAELLRHQYTSAESSYFSAKCHYRILYVQAQVVGQLLNSVKTELDSAQLSVKSTSSNLVQIKMDLLHKQQEIKTLDKRMNVDAEISILNQIKAKLGQSSNRLSKPDQVNIKTTDTTSKLLQPISEKSTLDSSDATIIPLRNNQLSSPSSISSTPFGSSSRPQVERSLETFNNQSSPSKTLSNSLRFETHQSDGLSTRNTDKENESSTLQTHSQTPTFKAPSSLLDSSSLNNMQHIKNIPTTTDLTNEKNIPTLKIYPIHHIPPSHDQNQNSDDNAYLLYNFSMSPLHALKSFRFSKRFDPKHWTNISWTNRINPHVKLCSFDICGQCNNDQCEYQHLKDYIMSEDQIIRDYLSYINDLDQPKPDYGSNDQLQRIQMLSSKLPIRLVLSEVVHLAQKRYGPLVVTNLIMKPRITPMWWDHSNMEMNLSGHTYPIDTQFSNAQQASSDIGSATDISLENIQATITSHYGHTQDTNPTPVGGDIGKNAKSSCNGNENGLEPSQKRIKSMELDEIRDQADVIHIGNISNTKSPKKKCYITPVKDQKNKKQLDGHAQFSIKDLLDLLKDLNLTALLKCDLDKKKKALAKLSFIIQKKPDTPLIRIYYLQILLHCSYEKEEILAAFKRATTSCPNCSFIWTYGMDHIPFSSIESKISFINQALKVMKEKHNDFGCMQCSIHMLQTSTNRHQNIYLLKKLANFSWMHNKYRFLCKLWMLYYIASGTVPSARSLTLSLLNNTFIFNWPKINFDQQDSEHVEKFNQLRKHLGHDQPPTTSRTRSPHAIFQLLHREFSKCIRFKGFFDSNWMDNAFFFYFINDCKTQAMSLLPHFSDVTSKWQLEFIGDIGFQLTIKDYLANTKLDPGSIIQMAKSTLIYYRHKSLIPILRLLAKLADIEMRKSIPSLDEVYLIYWFFCQSLSLPFKRIFPSLATSSRFMDLVAKQFSSNSPSNDLTVLMDKKNSPTLSSKDPNAWICFMLLSTIFSPLDFNLRNKIHEVARNTITFHHLWLYYRESTWLTLYVLKVHPDTKKDVHFFDAISSSDVEPDQTWNYCPTHQEINALGSLACCIYYSLLPILSKPSNQGNHIEPFTQEYCSQLSKQLQLPPMQRQDILNFFKNSRILIWRDFSLINQTIDLIKSFLHPRLWHWIYSLALKKHNCTNLEILLQSLRHLFWIDPNRGTEHVEKVIMTLKRQNADIVVPRVWLEVIEISEQFCHPRITNMIIREAIVRYPWAAILSGYKAALNPITTS